jgi:xanthine/uracil/vitamin C permease (AzgA family)
MLERFFRLSENGTTTGREIQAGLTTFAAMACPALREGATPGI